MEQVESYLVVKPWANSWYVLSEELDFVNKGVLIHVWGPVTLDEMIEHVEKQGHRPDIHFEKISITPDSVVAYCARCDSYVSSAAGNGFFGQMLEVSCPVGHR